MKCDGEATNRLPCVLDAGHLGRHASLMSTDGDTPCESCGRRRPLVGVTLSGPVHFNVCVHCAVVAIRTNGATSADLHFPVGPDDGDAA